VQISSHRQQTFDPAFYRPDALPVAQPTASEHWSELTKLWFVTWRCGRHCGWLAPEHIAGSRGRGTSRSTPGTLCHAGPTDTGRPTDDAMDPSVSCVSPTPAALAAAIASLSP